MDTGLAADRLKEMAATSSEKVYDTEDLGPVATIKASLTVIQQLAANLAQKMAECENELAISGQTQSQQQSKDSELIMPIVVRANAVRKESEETKILSRYLYLFTDTYVYYQKNIIYIFILIFLENSKQEIVTYVKRD